MNRDGRRPVKKEFTAESISEKMPLPQDAQVTLTQHWIE
jgi:hypothetical protein